MFQRMFVRIGRSVLHFQGYISAEEFMNIPELSINPLAHRLERIFESVNFKVMSLLGS